MFDKSITLLIQNLAFTARGELLIFRPEPSLEMQARVRRRYGAPQMRNGLRADHLTIPTRLKKTGQHRGHINVHLTWHQHEDKNETVAALHPDDLAAFGKRFMERLVQRLRECILPVNAGELAAEGFYALIPGEEFTRSLREFMDQPPREYRLRVRQLKDRAIDLMEIRPFEGVEDCLPDELLRGAPITIIREAGEGIETRQVAYYERGGWGGPPGWYSLPDTVTFTAVLDEVLVGALDPSFIEKMEIVARELQYEFQLERFSTASSGGK